MDNKEAIDILSNAAWLGTDTNLERIEEAVEIAIDALTRQTALKEKCLVCEYCARCDSELSNDSPELDSDFGELISRQKTIDTVHRMREIWDTGDIDDLEGMIVTALAELCPPQRIGKWLPEYGNPSAKAHYCSACNFYYTTDPEEMNYCPHCGAHMVTEEEM